MVKHHHLIFFLVAVILHEIPVSTPEEQVSIPGQVILKT